MFLASVFITIVLLIINMIIFIIAKSESNISQTAVIVIVAIVGSVLGIPILGFFIFHIYLACTRNTTREVLKSIEQKENEDVENQWCDVDQSNIDFWEEVTQEELDGIREGLRRMS